MISSANPLYRSNIDFLNSSEGIVEDLLRRIAATLQLTESQYSLAEERYLAVARYLARPESPLAIHLPDIYPQGSMGLGTTCRPNRLFEIEFDLDFVMELLRPPAGIIPADLLDLLEGQLRANGNYGPLVERKTRCIRLNYAGDFHMDILPALPDSAKGNGCIVVPDVPDGRLGGWKPSNPRGYISWFEDQTALAQFVVEAGVRAGIEPLPGQGQAGSMPPPLKVAVQLLKRHRDISFAHLSTDGPVSIVITTLAGTWYTGEPTVYQAVDGILARWQTLIDATPGILTVRNPSNTDEVLSERWNQNPRLYTEFKGWVREMRRQWSELQSVISNKRVNELLENMFGDKPTKSAIEAQAMAINEARGSKDLAVTSTGLLTTLGQAASVVPVRANTFYGSSKA